MRIGVGQTGSSGVSPSLVTTGREAAGGGVVRDGRASFGLEVGIARL